MKNVLKLGAVVLAIVMVLSMSVTAFASEVTVNRTNEQAADNLLSGGGVTIAKDIVMYNTSGSSVYEPNITYTYTVSNVAPTPTNNYVSDGTNTANVKEGKTGGLLIKAEKTAAGENNTAAAGTSASLVFGSVTSESGNKTTSEENVAVASAAKVSRNLLLSFDTSKFVDNNAPLPGIYRYKLTESSSDYTTAGVTKGTASDDRYIDVYVRWNTEGTDLEVYGVTMFMANESFSYDSTVTDGAFKVTGYDVATEGANVDSYHTYNLTVEKKVGGTLASKAHEFPFSIVLSESAATGVQFYSTSSSSDYVNPELIFSSGTHSVNSSLVSTGTGSVTLKHGDAITFVGLPMTTTATITEKDTTVDVYTATAKANTSAGTAQDLTLTHDGTNKTWATSTAVTNESGTDTVASNTVTFTNTLTEVSPTGVVLRVAPYALMLGVGLFLVLFSRRRKNQAEA